MGVSAETQASPSALSPTAGRPSGLCRDDACAARSPVPLPPDYIDPAVPSSLVALDLTRISHSFLNAVGAVIMTAMTVGAGLTATGLLAGIALQLLRETPGLGSTRIVETMLLYVACGGLIAITATLFIGLLHFVLPKASKFFMLLLRAPWFVPSTTLCLPVAALWRAGLGWREGWEAGLTQHGLYPQWSLRARLYRGRIDGRLVDVSQDILGGPLEFHFRVAEHLPSAYVGPQWLAGSVGVLRPLVQCPALTDAELLLRDGRLVIRRRWVRPNLVHLANLVAEVEQAYPGGLNAELQTVSVLDEWRLLHSPTDERWHSPWLNPTTIGRYLHSLRQVLRISPPPVDQIRAVLIDSAVREPAKAWLMSVIAHRITADEARSLAAVGPTPRDPVAALGHAPNWPAWVGVHLLALEGGPDALAPLHALIADAATTGALQRAARRATSKIIRRNGGVHTLTGHLSVVDESGGHLAVVEPGRLALGPKND